MSHLVTPFIGKSLENNLHAKNLNKLQCDELFTALRERKDDTGTSLLITHTLTHLLIHSSVGYVT